MLSKLLEPLMLAAALAGCASAPLDWPTPSSDVVSSSAGDYKAFVQVWMGTLPRTNWKNTFPLMPSDARLLPLRLIEGSDRQFSALHGTFQQWCTNSNGTVRRRSDDMVEPGDFIDVCEADASGEKIAALWIYLDPDSKREGRLEILVQHWHPPDIDKYIHAKQELDARSAANRTRARAERAEREQHDKLTRGAEEAARSARDQSRLAANQSRLAELMAAARLRTTPPCQRFERESNALLVRFAASVERSELQRYLSDLAVAHDECVHARNAPPAPLQALYSFNLQSFQLFADAWDTDFDRCQISASCEAFGHKGILLDQREIARLQERYPAIHLLSPEKVEGILDRVQRFVLDR